MPGLRPESPEAASDGRPEPLATPADSLVDGNTNPSAPAHINAAARLKRCRDVLAGCDATGRRTHPSVTDNGVISLASGDGLRRPEPAVVAHSILGMLEHDEASLERYFFGRTYMPLDDAIRRRFIAAGVHPAGAEAVVTAAGTATLLNAFLNEIVGSDTAILTGQGYYHSLASWAQRSRVELLCIPTVRRDEYKLTADGLQRYLTRRPACIAATPPRGLIIFNPTYTGALYTAEELEAIAGIIDAYDMYAIEDAIFMDTRFRLSDEVCHLACYANAAKRTITVGGGSKAHGLANVRIGWAIGPAQLVDRMKGYVAATSGTVPHPAKVMALAALKWHGGYLLINARECRQRARIVVRSIDKMNERLRKEFRMMLCHPIAEVEFFPSAGHSVLVSFNGLDGLIDGLGTKIIDSVDIARFLLREARVGVSPGLSLGFDGFKCRIAFAAVGAEATYADAAVRERTVLQWIAQHIAEKTLKRTELDHLLAGQRLSVNRERLITAFSFGRELLMEAICGRMYEALRSLLRANNEGLVRPASAQAH